jgi:glycine/D-amino acid oxidase-like deaminating enzyme
LNMEGRIVFELPDEPTVYLKKKFKSLYGLEGRTLSPEAVEATYGDRLPVCEDLKSGRLKAVSYPGGYFLAGFKENALGAAREKGVTVYDDAFVAKITIDSNAAKHAVEIWVGGEKKTIIADIVLLAAGDYGHDIIPVDGISTLFVVRTENSAYRIRPTGMGQGGTIHIVPVWKLGSKEGEKTYLYHLGKATNGAIVGRDPRKPKSIYLDNAFYTHLETHLKRILPSDGKLIWLTFTECSRPVTARQGYVVGPLKRSDSKQTLIPGNVPINFEAAGGCGLGGNTPIIPEVQAVLDRMACGK